MSKSKKERKDTLYGVFLPPKVKMRAQEQEEEEGRNPINQFERKSQIKIAFFRLDRVQDGGGSILVKRKQRHGK